MPMAAFAAHTPGTMWQLTMFQLALPVTPLTAGDQMEESNQYTVPVRLFPESLIVTPCITSKSALPMNSEYMWPGLALVYTPTLQASQVQYRIAPPCSVVPFSCQVTSMPRLQYRVPSRWALVCSDISRPVAAPSQENRPTLQLSLFWHIGIASP